MPKKTNSEILLNLACAGINAAVDAGHIDLSTTADSRGQIETVIFGRPSLVRWRGIGQGELAVTVWWSVKAKAKGDGGYPLNKNPKDALEACCTVWLERKTGRWIQCHAGNHPGLESSYLSNTGREALEGVPDIEGHGFERSGKFFL